MSVLGRGMTSPGEAPTTAKAKIFLTIPFTALALALAGALPGMTTGCQGAGVGVNGDSVDPGNVFTAPGPPGGPGGPAWPGAGLFAGWAATATAAAAGQATTGETTTGEAVTAETATGETTGQATTGETEGEATDGALGDIVAPGLLLGDADLLDNYGLLDSAGEVAWPAPGVGRTFTGEGLTPGQVRRLACHADLIPVVLGTGSEVLDLGRESRLASAAQLKRLWLRDTTCTFPGCTVPHTWCDAHHITWWSRHGLTDIANLALLCGRHHTIVHTKDLTATGTGTGVTWHL